MHLTGGCLFDEWINGQVNMNSLICRSAPYESTCPNWPKGSWNLHYISINLLCAVFLVVNYRSIYPDPPDHLDGIGAVMWSPHTLPSWYQYQDVSNHREADCVFNSLFRFPPKYKGSELFTLCEDNPLVKRGFPAQRASNETIFMSWCLHFSVNGLLTRYAKLRVAHASRMPGTFSPTRWRGNVPGIPGACATRNFMHMARGPWANLHLNAGNVYPHHKIRSLILKLTNTASALTRTGHFWSNI